MELEVSKSIEGRAESVLNLQPGSSISIAYHSSFGPHDDLMLLELDEKLLPDILNQRVSLRGQPDEDAVLCTQSKTYAVKFVGTSNSVFLIPPSSGIFHTHEDKDEGNKNAIASVMKLAPGCMEITETAPRLDNLRSLLSQNPYSFKNVDEMDDDDDDESETRLYTWDDLVDKIQASDKELRCGLDALYAAEINGYYRILHDDYKDTILNMLLRNIVLHDWSLNALNENDVINQLESDGFPREIARHCLKIYGDRADEGNNVWRLDEKRVCVHFAKRVLEGGKMKIESFMEEWKKKVIEGMNPRIEMLNGEVLTEKIGIETWIYGFSVSSLPSTPADRFALLFQQRAKWEWNDLEPFIRDLQVPGLSSEGLLLKYTRRSQSNIDIEPIFSAR